MSGGGEERERKKNEEGEAVVDVDRVGEREREGER